MVCHLVLHWSPSRGSWNFGQKMAQHTDEYHEIIDANEQSVRNNEKLKRLREIVQKRLNEARENYINGIIYAHGESIIKSGMLFIAKIPCYWMPAKV